jgi:ribosomal protein L18E
VNGETGATVGTVTLNTTHTNAGTYASDSWSFTGAANYNNIGNTTITDIIDKANATVTADDKTKTYGQLNPTLTATVVGEVTGGDPVNYTLSTSATQYSNVSTYVITLTLGSNPNYNVTPTNGTLTIEKANATVTADDKTKTYGQLNPTQTATVVGEVTGGDPVNYTLSTAATQYSNVGTYVITLTLGSNPNYNVTPTNGTLTIEKANATVTADDKTKTYGQLNPTLTATVVGEVTGGDPVNYTLSTAATQYSNVGTYVITLTLGSNPNYNVTPTNGTLIINPKDATVTADNKSKTYGDDNPTLTATVTGTVNGDTLNYSLSTTAVKFSSVGDYVITVTLGSNPNYNVTPTSGTLHINQKNATLTADNKTKTYGDDNPTLTATVIGTVNGDTLNYSLSTTALKFSNVGDYPITITLGSNPNYNVTPTSGTLHISQKNASVAADNKSKTYGNLNPALTATVMGTVNGDMLNYTLSTTATQFSNVGTYAITVTLGSNPNYNVTATNGTLTINKAHLTVTADNKSVQYSDPLPTLTATITGFVPPDTVAVLSGNPAVSTAAAITFYNTGGVSNAPGTYTNAIIPSVGTLSAANYDFPTANFVKGTLTVTCEDARAYYTGALFVSTSGPNSYTATVTLSATIKDITAVTGDPVYDAYPGDIRNARVTFVNRDNNTVIASNLPVGLVNNNDTTVGTVTYNWTVTIPNNSQPPSQTFTIGIIVTPYYTDNSSSEDTVVIVSQPQGTGSITGGGYLVMQNSAGQYLGGVGTKNNFGFNVQNTRTGVKGNINTIIRNNGHSYQIKGNSMTSLSINTTITQSHPYPTATFNGKASLQDITDPYNPISIDGNATLQVTMTDRGEPGSSDSIGTTVWAKTGGLYFSSNWNGTQTVEQTLGGGNLQVH